MSRQHRAGVAALVALGWVGAWVGGPGAAPQAAARERLVRAEAAGGSVVNLPYTVPDGTGNQWRIYQNGSLRQDGNQPIYSQGGMLMINGNHPQQQNNQARLDEKTGEVVFSNLVAQGGLQVTRRVLVDRNGSMVRYVDVLRNPNAQEQTVNLQISTNLNYGVNGAQMVADPKKKDRNTAWVAQTGAGAAVVEVFSGPGGKQVPTINWQQGNNVVTAQMQLTVPGNKEVALMHLHAVVPTQAAGVEMVNGLKESALMKSIPQAVRKLIVNWRVGQDFIGDVEILRGDVLDVVELRGGDQLRGTLKEKAYALKTFYGNVELPVDRVVGLMNVGQFRPRQLLVTVDGQIFGGALAKGTIDLELSSGQVTQVPLAQVSRVGYRKRAGEPDEWKFEKPLVLMRSGERVGVQMPEAPIEVATRYGRLQLKPESVAAVVLQAEEHGVHEVILTDGSRFAGLLSADTLAMTLDAGTVDAPAPAPAGQDAPAPAAAEGAEPVVAEGAKPAGAEGAEPAPGGGAGAQAVTFPTSAITRLQLSAGNEDSQDDAPSLQLLNGDRLVGTLTGELKIDTAFDTITVNAAEIKSLSHPGGEDSPGGAAGAGALDIQATLWDGSTLSGQTREGAVTCKLLSGVELKVPVALVEAYEQPRPQPSAQMREQIKAVIDKLNNEDWRERDRAEAQLIAYGPVAIGVLKELRENQPPEAQARIDAVLKELDKQRSGPTPPRPATGPAGRRGAAGPGHFPAKGFLDAHVERVVQN